jgi:DNA-binding LytR/AlgR family response regulator
MHDFRICASPETAELLRELFKSCAATESEDADIVFVEAGQPIPENGISVVFHASNVVNLVKVLNALCGKPDEIQILAGRKHQTWEPLRPENILFFRADGNIVYAITEKQSYEMKQKLFEIEKIMPADRFIRVSKSYIVNILAVQEIIPWFGSRLLLKIRNNPEHIEVSRNYVRYFKSFLGM